jgi:hypothetical protein
MQRSRVTLYASDATGQSPNGRQNQIGHYFREECQSVTVTWVKGDCKWRNIESN